MSTYNGFPYGITGAQGAVGAQGPQGAMGPYSYPAGANGAAGTYSIRAPSTALTFTDGSNEVLRISHNGEVEWKGPPSKGAAVLEHVLGNMIDSKVATAGMRQRTYMRACQSLLSKARQMSKDEFISYLETSIENRNSKTVLLALGELSKLDEVEE